MRLECVFFAPSIMYVLLLELIGNLFCLLKPTILRKSISISSFISSMSGLLL